jgi:pilus assembly protein Flp/PilA
MDHLIALAKSFAREEEGAQVVEYALVIAMVSIALVFGLRALAPDAFTTFIANVKSCLAGTACNSLPAT